MLSIDELSVEINDFSAICKTQEPWRMIVFYKYGTEDQLKMAELETYYSKETDRPKGTLVISKVGADFLCEIAYGTKANITN